MIFDYFNISSDNTLSTNRNMYKKKINTLCFLLACFVVCEGLYFRKLFCPFTRDRIANNDTDLFHVEIASVGENLKLPCCQKFKTDNNIWFKRNRFFTDEEKNFSHVEMWTFQNDWLIASIDEGDTGAYYCKEKWSTTTVNTFVYIIEVEYSDSPVVRGKLNAFNKYMETYINPISSYLKHSNDPALINLNKKSGLGLEVVIRWEPWKECDFCKGEKTRIGRCHIQPHVLNENLCVGICKMYTFSLHMDCQSNWTIAKMFPLLAEKAERASNFEAVAKCVGPCRVDIQPGFDYVKRLRVRMINVGTNLVMLCPGYNTRIDCYWRRDGFRLFSDEYDPKRKVSVNEFCMLYLNHVTKEEGGNYTCYLNHVFTQENKVIVEELYWAKSAAWWRHIKYLMYIIIVCFIIFIGGIAMGLIQRENFKKIKPHELMEMWSRKRFEHERLLPSEIDSE